LLNIGASELRGSRNPLNPYEETSSEFFEN